MARACGKKWEEVGSIDEGSIDECPQLEAGRGEARSSKKKSIHIPVMLEEVLSGLKASKGGEFLDCTFGGGGHSRAILEANQNNVVYAIDRDPQAVERAENEFEDYIDAGRLLIWHAAFSDLSTLLNGKKFNGILADLGVSSDQLSGGERGFSFKDTSALDMRMDSSASYSAADVVNETSERELVSILRRGGVSDFEARAVAREIVKARPLASTADLAAAVHRSAKSNKGFDSATLAFQAIRIEVNHEFDEIESLMDMAVEALYAKGRLVVISFHSLEDQLVAKRMRKWGTGDAYPANWPGQHEAKTLGSLLTKKALLPTEEELTRNSRSRSARLRIFERGEV
jgi:16S rRNA (cytosine1402-N4)-methyltransferase